MPRYQPLSLATSIYSKQPQSLEIDVRILYVTAVPFLSKDIYFRASPGLSWQNICIGHVPYETLQALALSYHIPFFSCQFHFTLLTLLLCLLVLHNTYEDRQNKENREAI